MPVTNIKGPQGPQGIQGPEGPAAGTYAERYEIVSNTIYYRGEAEPGSLDADPVWRIWKVTVTGLTASNTWASATNSFDKIWDNRSSYTYS